MSKLAAAKKSNLGEVDVYGISVIKQLVLSSISFLVNKILSKKKKQLMRFLFWKELKRKGNLNLIGLSYKLS